MKVGAFGGNRSTLMPGEIEDLLDDAEESYPYSDFVASVRKWFDEHEFITVRQQEALERIRDTEAPFANDDIEDDHFNKG